jgi:thiol-disulfide isomerase/thioredoxin
MKTVILMIMGLFMGFSCMARTKSRKQPVATGKIVLEISFTPEYKKAQPYVEGIIDFKGDSLTFHTQAIQSMEMNIGMIAHKVKAVDGKIKLVLFTDEPLTVLAPFWYRFSKRFFPGDSLSISYTEKANTCSGKGVENFELQDLIGKIFTDDSESTVDHWVRIQTLDDYLKWQDFCNDRLNNLLRLIDSYKNKPNAFTLEYLKKRVIYEIELNKTDSFMRLLGKGPQNSGLTPDDLTAICDSTLNDKWGKWLRANPEGMEQFSWGFYQYNRIQIWKKYGFDLVYDLRSSAQRRMVYYNSIKQNFKGLLRERLLQYVIADEVMKELGYNDPLRAMMLEDYYKQPGFPKYKDWMRNYEKIAAVKYPEGGETIPSFNELIYWYGINFPKKQMKGRIALINFKSRDCQDCEITAPALKLVQQEFGKDEEVAIISIDTDKDKQDWTKVTSWIRKQAYPSLCLFNTEGDLVPFPDPKTDNGKNLISTIRKMKVQLNDGPYVFYKGDTTQVTYIQTRYGHPDPKTTYTNNRSAVELKIMTDVFPNTFDVKLKPVLNTEPCVFEKPEKQLVLSDIEGNFDALRKLLQSNGVMDGQYNWTFGKGHLMLLGDMVDRGEQVTECLWLIYSLEEKAKAVEGYVHYVLGNHEVLNLSGDSRYVRPKYTLAAESMKKKFKDLYNEQTELGRWLRSKNIMEKVGDVLYTHGGIARQVNQLPLSLQQINDVIRPNYANRDGFKRNPKEPELMVLFSSTTSPFWYRGYYGAVNRAIKDFDHAPVIDSTFKKFDVKHIVTGHSIVGDTISMFYGGKVINTDVHHAEGKSEALLIEGNNFYRVNTEGKKILLFTEDKRRASGK